MRRSKKMPGASASLRHRALSGNYFRHSTGVAGGVVHLHLSATRCGDMPCQRLMNLYDGFTTT
jgi:hypothetical protein